LEQQYPDERRCLRLIGGIRTKHLGFGCESIPMFRSNESVPYTNDHFLQGGFTFTRLVLLLVELPPAIERYDLLPDYRGVDALWNLCPIVGGQGRSRLNSARFPHVINIEWYFGNYRQFE
jgi:hypothetical protein